MSSEMVPLSKSLVTDVALEFLLPLPLHRVKLAFMVRPGIKKGIGERYMQSILIWDDEVIVSLDKFRQEVKSLDC